MNIHFKKFILTNLLVTLILTIVGGILFYAFIPGYFHSLMPFLLLAAFLINLLTFRLIMGRKGKPLNIMSAVVKSFGIKFFSYIGMVVVLILIPGLRSFLIPLIIYVFALYIIFTVIEVKAFSAYVKKAYSS